MNIRPLYNNVVIEPIEAESKSTGGIVLTGSAAEKKTHGKVLAVGKGQLNTDGSFIPVDVEVGDVVIYTENLGMKSETIEGKDVLIMSELNILAVLEGS